MSPWPWPTWNDAIRSACIFFPAATCVYFGWIIAQSGRTTPGLCVAITGGAIFGYWVCDRIHEDRNIDREGQP